MNEPLEMENQKKIMELLKKNPGLHISKIAEVLNLHISIVQSELQHLEQSGLITTTTDNGLTCYFIAVPQPKTREYRVEDTRKQIYELISQNPGLYLSKIAELLGISVQLADYYLIYLERNKKIVAIKAPGEYYRRYYTVHGKLKDEDKKLLDVLGQEMLMKIVLLLLKYKKLRHKELCDKLGISSARLSYHLNKLVRSGIVDVSSHSIEKGYVIINEEEIIDLLKKYKIHLGVYLSMERFNDMWKDLNLFFFKNNSLNTEESEDK
jgi:predicted transcriptional regulator